MSKGILQLKMCAKTVADKVDWDAMFFSLQPLVIKDYVRHWPAYKKWNNLNYLKTKVSESSTDSDVIVPVELGGHYMSKNMIRPDIRFNELLDCFIEKSVSTHESHNHDDDMHKTRAYNPSNHMYLAQHDITEIPGLENDIFIPEIVKTSGKRQYYGSKIWLNGPYGALSPCHNDPYHNILCQIVGKKTILLIPFDQGKYMYPYYNSIQKNTSQIPFEDIFKDINITKICHEKEKISSEQKNDTIVEIPIPSSVLDTFPLLSSITSSGTVVVLEAGDALFIPRKYWHYCETRQLSCSLSYWWI